MVMQPWLKYLSPLLLRCQLILICGSSWKHMAGRFISYSRNVQIHLRWGQRRHFLSPFLTVRTMKTTISCSPFINSWGCVFSQASNNIKFALNTFKRGCLKGCWHDRRITKSETEMLAASPPRSILTDLRCVPEGQRIKQSYRARMQPAGLCCFQGGLPRPDSESRLYENFKYVND